ncbi:spermatogenesis associated 6-like protein [Gadus chalcogrammus]|uniref:spermatogenesis associated 6-like protein n=1 Tax=Gadus chalcogrammus TaxID=1042646 RepID=UPI0024C4C140|nr:spermatogenesis associated 6-like protein [Gadus chalcogrammus]
MASSWPGAGLRSSPPLRRSALVDRSPAPSKPSPNPLRSVSADGRMASNADSLSSPESDAPVGRQRSASPSALLRRYRQQQSGNSSSHGHGVMLGSVAVATARSRWNGPADSWEEVQERVRGLLTTPRAMRRLLSGSTVSEMEEVLTRRSISPGLP